MVVVFPISGHLKLKEPTLGVHVFEHTSTSHQSFSRISFGKDYEAIYFDLKGQDWDDTIQTICADQFDTKVCRELTDMALLEWYNDIFDQNEWLNEWMMTTRCDPPLAPCSFWCIHSLRATSGPAITQIITISLHYYKYHGEVWTISLSKEAGETK